MRHGGAVVTLGFVFLGVLAACGNGGGPDAGGDGPVHPDALLDGIAAVDAPATDGAVADAALTDAATTDGATTDGSAADALDCSMVGCSPPPMCTDGCLAPCGCCFCGEGATMTAGDVTYICSGGCWAVASDGGSG